MKKSIWIVTGVLVLLLVVVGFLTYSNTCKKSCGSCEVKIFGLKVFNSGWRECPLSIGFCGVSSKDNCSVNSDCVANGYKCINKNNITEVPSEIWRDCYNNTKYHLYCMCAGTVCKWTGGRI